MICVYQVLLQASIIIVECMRWLVFHIDFQILILKISDNLN